MANSFHNTLRIIIIAFTSILYIGTTYHSFQMNGEYLFDYQLNLSSDTTSALSILSWMIIAGLSSWLSFSCYKHYSNEPQKHIKRWLLVMGLITFVFIENRGWYCFILGLYLPILLVPSIYFIHGLIHGFDTPYYHWKVSVFNLTLIGILTIGSFLEYQNTLFIDLPEDEQYEVELSAYTIPTFLDWQVEMEIEIEDKETDESYEFDFSFGDGPYFSVYKTQSGEIVVKGEKSNSGQIFLVNLNDNTIEESPYQVPETLTQIGGYAPEATQ